MILSLFYVCSVLCSSFFMLQANSPSQFYEISMPQAIFIDSENPVFINLQINQRALIRIDSKNPSNGQYHQGELSLLEHYPTHVSYQIPFQKYEANVIDLNILIDLCYNDVFLSILGPNATSCEISEHSAVRGSYISETLRLFVRRDNIVTLFDLSKPIYKPRETLQFRILMLQEKYRFSPENFNAYSTLDVVYLEDPNQLRIAQWTNFTTNSQNLLQYKFTSDAIEGNYKLTALFYHKTKKSIGQFSVKDYSLPRFSLEIEPPTSLTINDQHIQFRICSLYATGNFVKSKLEGKVCLKPKHTDIINRPCLNISGRFNGLTKCLFFNESTRSLQLKNKQLNFWNSHLMLNVTVKDDESDFEMRKIRFGPQLERRDMYLRIVGKEYFKPGLPYYGSVEAYRLSDRPYVNATLLISIKSLSRRRSWAYTAIYRTDLSGTVKFHFPPLDGNQDYNLQVRQINLNDEGPTSGVLQMLPAISTKTLTEWVSETNQHIQIVPFDKKEFQKINCPNTLNLKLQGTTPIHDKTISVKIMSRGHIMTWYQYPPNLEFERANLCTNQDNNYSGHYNCSLINNNDVLVRCLEGWTGNNCLQPVCKQPCEMGVCIAPGKCQCRRGWRGQTCNICAKSRACKNGDCLYGDDCYCRPGWQGYQCDKRIATLYSLERENDPQFNFVNRIRHYRKLNNTFKRIKRRYMGRRSTISLKQSKNLLQRKTIFERDLEINLERTIVHDVRILVYLESLELIADSILIKSEDICDGVRTEYDSSKSSFNFNKKIVGPRSKVTLSFNSGSRAHFCSLRIADTALNRISETPISLSTDAESSKCDQLPNLMLNNLGSVKRRITRPCVTEELEAKSLINCFRGRLDRSPGHSSVMRNYGLFVSKIYSSLSSFKQAGLSILTNALLTAANCSNPTDSSIYELIYSIPYADNHFALFQNQIQSLPLSNITDKVGAEVKNRKNRLLTDIILREGSEDLWKFEMIDPNRHNLTLTTPDRITKWEASMYCLTEKGLWQPPPIHLTVSVPFFVKLERPPMSSIKRYEIFSIPVTIYNYFTFCYEVQLSLILPHGSQIHSVSNTKITTCLCANERKTHSFQIIPLGLGAFSYIVQTYSLPTKSCFNQRRFVREVVPHFDALNESMTIMPDGLSKTLIVSDLICLQKEVLNLNKSIILPADVIPESISNYIVYGGDVMGSTLANLDKLVNIPHGCGEQNLARMVPSIYVLDYYASTGTERSEIREKALKFIQKGYQDQLRYQLPDGSFSAFGASNNDHKGSTWLTAFVYKSFQDAKKYIFVNDDVLQNALEFLKSQQREDGCFEDYGTVFSKTIKGNFDSDDSSNLLLTAYVLISLSIDKPEPLTSKAMNCLKYFLKYESYSVGRRSNYSLALLSYVFVLYEPNGNHTVEMLEDLRMRSRKVNNREYWSDVIEFENETLSYQEAIASEIETTAYAYLALENFDQSSKLMASVRWLTEQRNSLGGFHSTQDTIVALKALANFAKRLNITSTTNITIRVNSDGFSMSDALKDNNKLLTSKKALPTTNNSLLTTQWSLEGSGCLFIQVISRFNVPYSSKMNKLHFPLTWNIKQRNCRQAKLTVCFMNEKSLLDTGMLLLTVTLPHGWELTDKSVLYKSWPNVKMVETENNLVHFYYNGFNKLDNSMRCLPLDIQENQQLEKINSNISVTLMDYYEPSKKSQMFKSLRNCQPKIAKKKTDDSESKVTKSCPICLTEESDSHSLLSQYLQVACPKSRSLIVVNRQPGPMIGYLPKEKHFFEWQIRIENSIHSNCSCSKLLASPNQDLLIVTSKRWKIIPGEPLLTIDGDFFITTPVLLRKVLPQFYSPLCQFTAPLHQLLDRLYSTDEQINSSGKPNCPICAERYAATQRFHQSSSLCKSRILIVKPDLSSNKWLVKRIEGLPGQNKPKLKEILLDYRCSCNIKRITKNFKKEIFVASFSRDSIWSSNSTEPVILTNDDFVSEEFILRSYLRRCEFRS